MHTPRRMTMAALAVGLTIAVRSGATVDAQTNKGLTAVPGLKVGHFTLTERPTGCTVVIAEAGAVAGVDVRGAAPGTRETDLLNPVNMVQMVHAVVLSGGSAFGLDTATGVMKYLEEKGVGFDVRVAKVPIVPAAILFDLGVGDAKVRPTADCGYRAAQSATDGPVAEGDVGAGAGASVGKLAGGARAMKAGLGTASITLPGGLVVAAMVAVNAVGDIIDPTTARVVAGVRTDDGKALADARLLVRSGATLRRGGPNAGENTTIGIVATNAKLTKVQASKMAQMAHDGYARAISPVHTMGDGDTIFALATGTLAGEPEMLAVGALAAEMMSEAIVRAATQSKGLPQLPSASQLGGR
ncbi:MAG: P1 family peptidase [Vicinamibacterales bacterium]